MADVKISALPAATTPLAGTEVLPIVQSATTKQVSIANVTAGRAISASSLTLTTQLSVANGGTGLTSLTAGYIPFGAGTSAFGSDSGLFWDNTNKRLGVGTSSPTVPLHVVKIQDATTTVSVGNSSTGVNAAVNLQLACGSTSNFNFRISDYYSYTSISGSGPCGVTGYIDFDTHIFRKRDNTEKFRIASDGSVGIGTSSPSSILDIYGSIANQASTLGTLDAATLRVRNNSLAGLGTSARINLSLGGIGSSVISGYYAAFNGSGDIGTGLIFGTQLNLAGGPVERMRIDANGNVLVTGGGGLGYGTGSGGAVTQATSRTTGVTLNKTNGAITLVSAAGSTSWQTFTVTNSTVAATDTVIVNQKSGTDLYQIFVTNVAAGSFKISFATTGGTTTEQPVFNFAVIKAVAA